MEYVQGLGELSQALCLVLEPLICFLTVELCVRRGWVYVQCREILRAARAIATHPRCVPVPEPESEALNVKVFGFTAALSIPDLSV